MAPNEEEIGGFGCVLADTGILVLYWGINPAYSKLCEFTASRKTKPKWHVKEHNRNEKFLPLKRGKLNC